MHTRSQISHDRFRQLRGEVFYELSRHSNSPDSDFYVQQIHATLNHLEQFFHIRTKDSRLETYHALYDLNAVFNYDLSSIQAVRQLSFTYYKEGEEYINYSLEKWLLLHANFILHEQWLHQIAIKVAPFIRSSDPANREVKRSFERLYHVVYIQDRHIKRADLCYPSGAYSKEIVDQYDLSSLQNLLNLEVEHLDNSHRSWILARSVQAGMDRLLRHQFYKQVESRVQDDLVIFSQDHVNHLSIQAQCNQALWRLDQVIRIRNESARHLAMGTLDAPFYYEDVLHCDLSSAASLSTLRVHTSDGTKKKYQMSVNDILKKLKAPRTAKGLFNAIYDDVMAVVYHLQELVEKEAIEAPLKIPIRSYLDNLAFALRGLYLVIETHCQTVSHDSDCRIEDFTTIDAFFNAIITLRDGSRTSLLGIILHGADFAPDLLDKLRGITTQAVLSDAKIDCPIVMQASMFSSIVKAKKLCALIEKGNLDEIRQLQPTAGEVNLLIELPLAIASGSWSKLSFINIMKDMNVMREAVTHSPVMLFLGRYNALILAVCYRHYHVVAYFINQLHANPDIKGGRKRDYSARDCANLRCPILNIGPIDPRITNLLDHCQSESRRLVVHGTFAHAVQDEEVDGFIKVSSEQSAYK